MESNSRKLIGETNTTAVDVDAVDHVPILQEEDDDGIGLADIPLAGLTRRSKRQRADYDQNDDDFKESGDDESASAIEIDSDTEAPPYKRHRARAASSSKPHDEGDDKKKLAMDVSYEGFAIYGKVLCLVVKRRETGRGVQLSASAATNSGKERPEGQAMMENWISSTQVPVGQEFP